MDKKIEKIIFWILVAFNSLIVLPFFIGLLC